MPGAWANSTLLPCRTRAIPAAPVQCLPLWERGVGQPAEAQRDAFEAEIASTVKVVALRIDRLKDAVVAAQQQERQAGASGRLNEQTAAHFHGMVGGLAGGWGVGEGPGRALARGACFDEALPGLRAYAKAAQVLTLRSALANTRTARGRSLSWRSGCTGRPRSLTSCVRCASSTFWSAAVLAVAAPSRRPRLVPRDRKSVV